MDFRNRTCRYLMTEDTAPMISRHLDSIAFFNVTIYLLRASNIVKLSSDLTDRLAVGCRLHRVFRCIDSSSPIEVCTLYTSHCEGPNRWLPSRQ